jgi:hypothetical protein
MMCGEVHLGEKIVTMHGNHSFFDARGGQAHFSEKDFPRKASSRRKTDPSPIRTHTATVKGFSHANHLDPANLSSSQSLV